MFFTLDQQGLTLFSTSKFWFFSRRVSSFLSFQHSLYEAMEDSRLDKMSNFFRRVTSPLNTCVALRLRGGPRHQGSHVE